MRGDRLHFRGREIEDRFLYNISGIVMQRSRLFRRWFGFAFDRLSFASLLLGLIGLVWSAPSMAALNISMTVPQPAFPLTINPGDATLFVISLTNSNHGAAVTNVDFSDALPAGLTIAANTGGTNPTPLSYSCTDGNGNAVGAPGTLTATVGTSLLSLANGVVPIASTNASGPNGQCVINLPVTSVSAGATLLNTIAVGAVTGQDDNGNLSNGTPAIQSINVASLAAPTIDKRFSSSSVVKGDQTVRMTVTIGNTNNPTVNLPLNGVGDSPAYALRDIFPAGLAVAAVPNAQSICSGGGTPPGFTPAAGATTLMAIGGTVAGGGTCTLSVDVVGTTVATTGADTHFSNNVTNTINGSHTVDFGNKRNLDAANATATLTVNSALQVTKQFDQTTISASQESFFTIKLTNTSPVTPITITNFSDSPIDGVAGGSRLHVGAPAAAPTTTCAGTISTVGNAGISLTGGSIAPNGSCTIKVPFIGSLAVAGVPESFTNTIPEGAVHTNDTNITSQTATHSVTVVDQLLVDKSASPRNVAPGNPVNYTITVRNYSSSPLSNVSVPDTLPPNMIGLLSPAPTLSAGCGTLVHNITPPPGTGSLQFTIPTLPAGVGPTAGVCTINFWAMASKTATVSSTADNRILAHSVGAGGITNSTDAVVSTTIDPTITIGKVFNPGSAFEGTVSVLTLTLTNISALPVTSATFTDTLPLSTGTPQRQMIVASPADASTTCVGGTVTAVPGSNAVTLSGATIPARGSNGTGNSGGCQVQVKIIGPAGSYTNRMAAGTVTGLQQYADNSAPVAVSNTTDAQASMTYTAALVAAKSFSPTTISDGGKSTVRLHFGNTGTGTLNNVSTNDVFPPNMTVASPSNAYSTCAGTPVITATPAATNASVSGIVLPPSGQCDVLFDVIGTGGASWTNTLPGGSVTATGGVSNTSDISATLLNSTAGGVSVTVSAVSATTGNSSLSPGEPAVLTITVRNDASLPLTGLNLSDYFTVDGLASGALSGIQLASTPNLSTTCQGGLVTANNAGTAITLSNANLAGGAGTTCTITANVTLVTTGTVQDIIPPHSIRTSQGVSNINQAITSLSSSGNVGVIKTFSPPVIKPGERTRLRLTLINAAAVPLTDIIATDNLPSGMVVPTGANPVTTCTGATVSAPTTGKVMITGGSLPGSVGGAAVTCYGEIDVQAASVGSLQNVINIGDVTGNSGGPVQNGVPAKTTLQVRNPVTIGKAFAPAQVAPGVVSTVTITLNNSNTAALTSAVLVDALPTNVVVAQTPNASTTCTGGFVTASVSATSVTLTGGTIPANGSCQIKVDVLSNIAGVYVNTIPAGGLATAEGVTNETPVNATLTVLDPPSVNKQFNPVSIAANGTSTLSIVLGNTNAAGIPVTLSADLVDTLPLSPSPIVVAAVPAIGGNCTTANVTANPGAGTVTYRSGSTIPAGGCTITVDVTGTVPGTYNNFIPVGGLKTNAGNNVQPASANLVISPLGFVSGKVFKDNNVTPNGTFESGTDTALANVTITLTGSSYGSDGVAGGIDDSSVSLITTTDALGNYAFTGLNAGVYVVTEPTQPTGTSNGITTAGTTGGVTNGTATPVSTPISTISGITLIKQGNGQVTVSSNNNFAEVVLSSISGTVFLDQNNNGLKELADTALAGVTVELLNGSGTVLTTAVTDAAGAYSFPGLPPGTYSVREPTQPADTANGLTVAGTVGNGGTSGSVTNALTTPSKISNIILPPATTSSGNNFAEVASGRQVAGRVFGDGNNDGLFNNGETGLAGVTLNLSGTDINGQPVTKTTVTDADGHYNFSGLPEGTYTVTEPTQPPHTNNGITTAGTTGGTASAVGTVPSHIDTISLTGTNTVSSDNNFAEVPILVGTVSGKVYVDANSNGVFEGGESPIKDVTVRLTGTDNLGAAVTLETTTGVDGSYTFGNLQPSNAAGYTITEVQPALYTDGRTTIAGGNPGATASGKPVLPNNADVIRGVTVAAGDTLNDYNYGEGGALAIHTPIVNGYVYLDSTHTRERPEDGSAAGVSGWTAQLTQNGKVICTTTTDATGFYEFDNLHCPGYETSGLPTGPGYAISFSKEGNVLPQTPTSGEHRGVAASGGKITGITLSASDEVIEQNLPLDPSGVVYDSQTRKPITGAQVTITGPAGFDPATQLVGGNATETTGSDGFYQFLLQNNFPTGVYTLSVTAPGYQGPSGILPVCNGTASIGLVPDPALVQGSNTAPSTAVPAANPAACVGIVPGGAPTSQYYFSFFITNGGSANILNNHIPLDLSSNDVIYVTKTSPMVNVSRGDLVPYTITATSKQTYAIAGTSVRDQIPPGFKYRAGSATANGVAVEPQVNGRLLTWPNQNFAPKEKKTYRLILTIGSGVGDGNYTNQAWAAGQTGSVLSNVGQATVRIVPDPTFDCPDIIGKVFDDQNANGYQDQDEPGIASVRVVTPRGLLVTTDAEGRFHVPCPDIPNEDRGSNFVMKLDVRTLPSGYRVTTENPRDVRITRGKVTKLNFGATIHRVVRLELSDAAFTAGDVQLLPDWQKQLDALPEQLKVRPSVVRLAYQPGNDDAALAAKRIEAIRKQIQDHWHALKGQYTLNIETEDAQ